MIIRFILCVKMVHTEDTEGTEITEGGRVLTKSTKRQRTRREEEEFLPRTFSLTSCRCSCWFEWFVVSVILAI